jgi:hypothetical protein
VSWDRTKCVDALVPLFAAANPTVKVLDHPTETINPPAIVIHRPTMVTYANAGFGVDTAELPVLIGSGLESEDQIETIKTACRSALCADVTLGGVVAEVHAASERNWRNQTGAGGIQLLTVELVLSVTM